MSSAPNTKKQCTKRRIEANYHSGSDNPTKGGPTARAQTHQDEPINSETLHDITEGEKKVTGGERVKSGPTAIAQSILAGVSIS